MKKMSIGRLLSFIGILFLSIGLICNGFELVSVAVFRGIVLVGIILQAIALVFILKNSEF
ncbi:MAG: hypothetical protein J6K84_05325 [Oscillospiraceae bacterium]|nr:hypothetical protein [Oscillospiraceae bacterium]